jgi:hypothetical protein
MMAADFSNWVKDWNQKLQATMRKIMLIVDNAPTHMVQGVTPEHEHGLQVFSLSNIKVTFLPPNVTAKSQPCDQPRDHHRVLQSTLSATPCAVAA